MKNKSNIKIELTVAEKQELKANKVRIIQLLDYAVDELEALLKVPFKRAQEIHALAEFQTVPSLGIKFAEDLVSMGYYAIEELKGKDGAKLTEDFETLKGYWIDPCVEDQFRLIVYYANTKDPGKNWWDFTTERKKHRLENGYPLQRPKKAWYEISDRK